MSRSQRDHRDPGRDRGGGHAVARLTIIAGLAARFRAAGIIGIALLATRRANGTTHIPLGPFLITAAAVIATLHP